jgi:hypothetical protein
MANFGWAHPNRVVGQAVFKKVAAGHPKFGAAREMRVSPWGFALIASRLDAPDVHLFFGLLDPSIEKRTSKNIKNRRLRKQVWGRLEAGFPLVRASGRAP